MDNESDWVDSPESSSEGDWVDAPQQAPQSEYLKGTTVPLDVAKGYQQEAAQPLWKKVGSNIIQGQLAPLKVVGGITKALAYDLPKGLAEQVGTASAQPTLAERVQNYYGGQAKTGIQALGQTIHDPIDMLRQASDYAVDKAKDISEGSLTNAAPSPDEMQRRYNRELANQSEQKARENLVKNVIPFDKSLPGEANKNVAEGLEVGIPLLGDIGAVSQAARMGLKTGSKVLSSSGELVNPATYILGNEKVLTRQILKPTGKTGNIAGVEKMSEAALPEIYRATDGKGFNTFQEMADAHAKAFENVGKEYRAIQDTENLPVLKDVDIGDKLKETVDALDANKRLLPKHRAQLGEAEKFADTFRIGTDIPFDEAQKLKTSLGNELSPIWDQPKNIQKQLFQEPNNAVMLQAYEELGNHIDDVMKQVGGERGAELKQAYGGLAKMQPMIDKKLRQLANANPLGPSDKAATAMAIGGYGASALLGHADLGFIPLTTAAGMKAYSLYLKKFKDVDFLASKLSGRLKTKFDAGIPGASPLISKPIQAQSQIMPSQMLPSIVGSEVTQQH